MTSVRESPYYQALRGWASRHRQALLLGAGGVVSVLVVVLISLGIWNTYYRTHQETAFLGDRTWAQAIEIEKYKAEQHESWSSPPSDAYDESSRMEIRSWEHRLTGYTTSFYSCGSSSAPRTCTRQEPQYTEVPIYDRRYRYKVNRWKTDEWVWTRGTAEPPLWATPPIGLVNVNVLGNRRLGDDRRGEYSFEISCSGCDSGQVIRLDFEEWNRLRSGQLVIANVNSRGKVRGIE